MSSQVTLKQVLTLLKSDKSKDRQQGISSLKDAFGRREAIQKLDAEKKDGRAWLIVFQALFSTVLSERAVVLKKGGLSSAAPASVRRLEDAAGAVRWLVERSVAEWNGKVCKPLIKHLMQSIVHHGKLFPPVALHYVKALRVICAYPPHLDHIQFDEVQTISILSLSFAAVLGDNLKGNLEDEAEGMSEDEVMDELSEDDEGSGSSRKRKRSPERARLRVTPMPKSVSLEQIEFVAIISIILRSPRIRLIHPDHPRLPRALLDRLRRFFQLYSSDTSAHLDMMSAVNSSLDNLALNCKDLVAEFGAGIWDSLLSLWSTKSRDLKESILAALTTLLPHVAHPDVNFDRQDGVGRLLRFLHGEHDARWGFESLSFDSLRLEIIPTEVRRKQVFTAHTFTYGFGFTASQVVAWTMMELQADCMKELYLLSESIHPGTPSMSRSEGKRAKLVNPVASLLQSVQKHQSPASRSFHLQCLLFFIDRHWGVLHPELQLDIANTLLQVVTIDDAISQSWVFACLAAVSFAERAVRQSKSETEIASNFPNDETRGVIPWDAIWSHAMRRTSSPAISRAACHAAHVLLVCEWLPSNRVLTEIEAMMQDISVQGPTAPFDSVCAFLSKCLKVASQDARLYRMHMEDKVLSWLSENMNSLGGHLATTQGSSNTANVNRLEQYYVHDVLSLLQTACSLSQLSCLVCPLSLPDHFLVQLQKDRLNAAIIREFLLHAVLPSSESSGVDSPHPEYSSTSDTAPFDYSSQLASPGIRERKASALLLKLVEAVARDWESRGASRPTAESVRRMLDFAVLAIAFESLLIMNGMTSTKRSILVGCKLISTLVQCLTEMHWTYDELTLLCEALLPLTSGEEKLAFDDTWDGIVDPGPATGISTVASKSHNGSNAQDPAQLPRRKLQGIIWQSADVQDALDSCMKVFKRMLNSIVSGRPLRLSSSQLTGAASMVADDEKDDFAPIRTAKATSANVIPGEETRVDRRLQDIARICVDVLTMIPILQSSEQRSTRDKYMVELVCDSVDNETFSALVEPFVCHVQLGSIYVGPSALDKLFTHIGGLLESYKFGQSEAVQMLAISILHATANVWLDAQLVGEDVVQKALVFYHWAVDVFQKSKLRSWRTRKKMVEFLELFLRLDPLEAFVSSDDEEEDKFDAEKSPGRILPLFNKDGDIRVRFTAACASARLFSTAYILGKDPMAVYGYIRDQLCVVLGNFEEMLSRMLCLGNIVITSSCVRRGPLWHTVETCLWTTTYIRHVTSILHRVAIKLGMSRISPLLEAYASQIAFAVRATGYDIFRLPPQLLGYNSKREFAEATFASFSPANLLKGENGDIEGGRTLFKRHCSLVGMSEEDGLWNCFSDVVGYHITTHFSDMAGNGDRKELQDPVKMEEDSVEMGQGPEEENVIMDRLCALCPGTDVPKLIEGCVDGVVFSIVRTLGDFDSKEGGPIVFAIEEQYALVDKVSRAFRFLMRFRGQDEFNVHPPNLPTCSTRLVLKSLKWLSEQIESVKSAGAVYHVIQTLFAEVARSPVVNEQIRLMTGLCLYISVNYVHFKNVSLLRVLLNGSASLLSNAVLVGFAQGILDWTFIHVRDLNCDAPHLSAILIRIGCAARDYCRSTDDFTKKQGMQLKTWIEDQLARLHEVPLIQFRVLSALAAWPDQLPADLEDLRSNLTSENLSAILDDPYLPFYNFKVVRHILGVASRSTYSNEQFAKRDFWRLKDSVPTNILVDEEATALSKLLVLNLGRVDSHTIDQQSKRSIAIRHQIMSLKEGKGKKFTHSNIKIPITLALLDLLAEEDFNIVSVAYRTLRQIAATDPLDSFEFGPWPAEYRADANLLNFCPIRRYEELTYSIHDIKKEEFVALGSDFSEWVSQITKFLAGLLAVRGRFFSHLRRILETNISFAEEVFPVLVHEVLSLDYESKGPVDSPDSNRTILSTYITSLLSDEKTDVRCLSCLVNTVLHLRHYFPVQNLDALLYNRWLSVDYTLLSRSAIVCGAYTTALLFLELATDGSPDEKDHVAFEQILFDIYSHIEEPDGFYGIKSRDPRKFLLKRFRHERQWEKSFQFHGARFEAGEVDMEDGRGIVESLHSFGFNRLALSSLESSGYSGMASSESSALTYRLGWRAETWDLPDLPTFKNSSSTLYSTLKSVHREQDLASVDKLVNAAIWNELHHLRGLANENLVEIRQVTQTVMCLAQIKEWRSDPLQSDISARSIESTSTHWETFCDIAPGFAFDDLESILATRISLLRSMRQREQRDQIGSMLSDMSQNLLKLEVRCLIRLSEAARDAREKQIALNSVVRAQNLDQEGIFEVSTEFASVLWDQGEQRLAIEFLKKELERRNQVAPPNLPTDKMQFACIYAKLGEWASEACLEKPEFIQETYFVPAINLMGDLTVSSETPDSHNETLSQVFYRFALFAERQYHALVHSDEIVRFRVYAERKRQEIVSRQESIDAAQGPTKDQEKRQLDKARKLLKQDTDLYEQVTHSRDSFLLQAVQMLSNALAASDTYDGDASIRLCSLWLSNFRTTTLDDTISSALDKVPSRKLVFLAHQLSARLTNADNQSANQKALQTLVLRMGSDHPFHSLYQVYALQSSDVGSRRISAVTRETSSQRERVGAASDIFDRLQNEPRSASRVRNVRYLCDAYLEWAKHPIRHNKSFKEKFNRKESCKVPAQLRIRKISSMPVPVTTSHTPLDPTMRYDQCVCIKGYDDNFEAAGGINLPKISRCIGSDGNTYKQLFKGEGDDDMRQDAVMEQVFEVCNQVLHRDRSSRKRNLGIRSYKVVPLAAQAGLLEFVVNTTPLGEWLKEAHPRYYKKDWSSSDCARRLSAISKESKAVKVKLLRDIKNRFHPVLRHFFTEQHRLPLAWFEMRLNYTRSVATTSIIGHILGLGDRHINNILLDTVSGEVVHIDLGIAFDQGKLLGVPEIVPFRLTPDIVDGFGISGTEGVFRRCAEETLRVLRDDSEVIKTVLEVFKYDPLHQWTADSVRLRKAQGGSSVLNMESERLGIGIDMDSATEEENADRALSGVARKLDKSLSVEFTVNELVSEATDENNLAQMFPGWSPHC